VDVTIVASNVARAIIFAPKSVVAHSNVVLIIALSFVIAVLVPVVSKLLSIRLYALVVAQNWRHLSVVELYLHNVHICVLLSHHVVIPRLRTLVIQQRRNVPGVRTWWRRYVLVGNGVSGINLVFVHRLVG
jgi:hypothetical protein